MIKRKFIGRDIFYMIGELESKKDIAIENYQRAKYRCEDEGRDQEDRQYWQCEMYDFENQIEDINRELYELREYIACYNIKIWEYDICLI